MNTVILVVTEAKDASRGEVHLFEEAEEATRKMEAFLEAGVSRDRMQVFLGDIAAFEVTQRPVVMLADENSATKRDGGENGDGADRRRMSDFFRSAADDVA